MTKPLEPEARIGSYELVRRIGVGGMAEVWVARRVSERRANKYVAIKVVADPHVGDPRFQRMFKTEVELSALLNHVNIVQVFDEGEDDGRSYLVMEWVDGVNLLKVEAALTFIDDEPWRLKVISYVVGQLLYALHYAHSITLHDGNPLGIVHRDVSPQNVLVSTQGEVKLTDFGVAHTLLEESSGVHVKGKLRYMAPEQLAGKTRDPRIDLYAVGAILHELLDGRRFRHHVEDQREMYIEVISGKLPALSRSVPPELEALRLGLLEPDVARRIASADLALEQLARFAGYGDARRELTQLCGGLTGVMRPRVGPGMSEQVPAATGVSVAAPRMESSRVASQPEEAAEMAPASTVEPDPLASMRSKTLRMGDAAAGHEPIELDATQPWLASGPASNLASAVPRPVATAASAPIYATSEATDPASPATATMRPVVVQRTPAPARAYAWVTWMVASVVVAGAFGGGTWWVVAGRPASEGSAKPVAIDDRPLERAPAEERALPLGPVPLATKADPPSDADTSDADTGDAASTGELVPAEGASTGDVDALADTSTDPSHALDDDKPPGETTPPDPPEPAAPRPKQALTLVAVATLGAVQVEVRSKDGSIRKRYELHGSPEGARLPVGSYTVKWRSVGASQWSKGQGVVLRRGCDLRIVIERQAIKPIPMGSACR